MLQYFYLALMGTMQHIILFNELLLYYYMEYKFFKNYYFFYPCFFTN